MNNRRSTKSFTKAAILVCACIIAAGIGIFALHVVSTNTLLTTDSREANWKFEELNDQEYFLQDPSQDDDKAEQSSETVQSENGSKYSSNRVLLTFDGNIDEEDLRTTLQKEGVEAQNVSLVSKMLGNNQVLVSVDYVGDEDPQDLSNRLV